MSILLDQITKRYQGTPVVNDVSLEIAEGEFFVLLGPSGSGKSTLLRAISGLTGVDHGRISLHGRDVTHLSPRQREVGFVFQNYALFRHMTVADNIEFALRVRRVKKSNRIARRKELLKLVALEGMDDRLPSQLSGGQQQRVAVARALAHKPSVVLLDEPFGALDAKIREELRTTIREVQRELGITIILVTHDQEEAFALADRIGVMNLGRLLEVGRPDELYTRPATRFVATFLGAANLLLARQTADGIRVGTTPIGARATERTETGREQEVVAVLRPEEIELAASRDDLNATYLGAGTVQSKIFTGALERLRVHMAPPCDVTDELQAEPAILDITRTQHEQRHLQLTLGQKVVIGVRRIHVLPTPLSSFTAYATSEAAAQKLRSHPLLDELATRMKTRIATRVEPSLGAALNLLAQATPLAGVAVVGSSEKSSANCRWLLARGAREILLLPEQYTPPQRVLIHWTGESVRRATLAVSASVLRHVPAEAIYVGILPGATPEAQRPSGVRDLLDARSEAQALHGLDMRTELRFGDVAQELTRQLAEAADQMLILGITDPAQLETQFAGLLAQAVKHPILIVCRSG
ncbi:MAG TPA: ATP-binding cassette domain-containing protein, partial [Steroidobacteraceae bacterium]|nr:ATP-binding cassette domain-containing protein [Steroidobacteraceae bacterium]